MVTLLHGVESDTQSQRGHTGRQKQEKVSSFLALRHHQWISRPTAWESRGKAIFSERMGKPRHVKWCCSGFKENRH